MGEAIDSDGEAVDILFDCSILGDNDLTLPFMERVSLLLEG
jgi:hypothetical protein